MKIVPSSFTRYQITSDETISGGILPSLTLAVLQNMRCDIAEQKLNLEFTPNDVLSYTQQEAFLKGQLDLLQHLIITSEESQKLRVQVQVQVTPIPS